MCEHVENRARSLGLEGVQVFLMEGDDGVKEYALAQGQDWVYSSQKAEAIWAHVEMMYLSVKHSVSE